MFWQKKKEKIWKENIEYHLNIWFVGDKLSHTIKKSPHKEEIEKYQNIILDMINSNGKRNTIKIEGALIPISEFYMSYHTEDNFLNVSNIISVTIRKKVDIYYVYDSE